MPKTPEGKAISSRNAVKHGLNSNQLFVLQNENPEAWNALLEETIQEFQPETPFEHRIIREIAFTKWRLQRAWHIEQSLMNNEMDNQAEDLDTKYEDLKETSRQGFAFRSISERRNPGGCFLSGLRIWCRGLRTGCPSRCSLTIVRCATRAGGAIL